LCGCDSLVLSAGIDALCGIASGLQMRVNEIVTLEEEGAEES
jgi:hypothetical protein